MTTEPCFQLGKQVYGWELNIVAALPNDDCANSGANDITSTRSQHSYSDVFASFLYNSITLLFKQTIQTYVIVFTF